MLNIMGLLAFHGSGGYGAYQVVALLLIALGVGCLVGMKAQCQEGKCCRIFGKVVGWIIFGVATLALLCLGYRCIAAG